MSRESRPGCLKKQPGLFANFRVTSHLACLKNFVTGLGLMMAWLQLTVTITHAQPSVYSGVYAYGEGGLTTASD